MKSKILFLVILLSGHVYAETLNDILSLTGQKHKVLGSQILEKNYDKTKKQKKRYIVSFADKNNEYDLELRSPVSGKEFTRDRKNGEALIIKNYLNEPLPYQGEITSVSVCPKEFIPVQIQKTLNGDTIYIVKYYTGKAYSYRICDKKLIKHRTCSSFYYNEKKQLYYKLRVSLNPEADCVKSTTDFFENLENL